MRTSFLSLLAVARAVVVTETEHATFYVTLGANGLPTPVSTDVATTSASSSTEAAANYVYTTSSSSSEAATTSSSEYVAPSTSSSVYVAPSTSSSVYVAPTTSSSSSVYVAPTTSSSSSTTSTTSSTTSSAASSTSSFEATILDYHNKVRAEHQVGSLSWNSTLATYAEDYLFNDNCVFQHSGGPYGENIAIGYATILDAEEAWYNEEDDYNYSAGQYSDSTGHFTQMVWKATTQIGCATYDCSGRTFLACEYYPRGNIIGEFTENVFS